MRMWECKLRLFVPAWNTVVDCGVQRMTGTAVSIRAMRVSHTADTEENFPWIETGVPAAAKSLA